MVVRTFPWRVVVVVVVMLVIGTGEGLGFDGYWYLKLGTNVKNMGVGFNPTFPASVERAKEG